MKVKSYNVFKFDELSEESQQRAIDKFSENNLDYDWWKSIYDDAENIGLKITSFDLDRNRHAKGNFISAFKTADKIIENHGPDCETFKTAKSFIDDMKKINFDCEAVDGDDDTNCESYVWQDKREDCEKEFLRSLLEDYSIMLQNEYEYQQSYEVIIETIKANDYDFTENGRMD